MGTKTKDAAAIKALEELGLKKEQDSNSLSPQIQDLENQLNNYEAELGDLDPTTLEKYLKVNKTLDTQ